MMIALAFFRPKDMTL